VKTDVSQAGTGCTQATPNDGEGSRAVLTELDGMNGVSSVHVNRCRVLGPAEKRRTRRSPLPEGQRRRPAREREAETALVREGELTRDVGNDKS
jgi:hypothetical protein